MFPNLFWEIVHRKVHLFSWCKSSSAWFNCENLLFEDILLESLFCAWLTWISPSLHLYFAIIRHFESPIRADTAYVFESQSYFPWLGTILDWHLSKVPGEHIQAFLDLVVAARDLVRVVELNLSRAQREKKLFVHFGELKSFPKISNADLIVPDVSESQ